MEHVGLGSNGRSALTASIVRKSFGLRTRVVAAISQGVVFEGKQFDPPPRGPIQDDRPGRPPPRGPIQDDRPGRPLPDGRSMTIVLDELSAPRADP